MTGVTPGTDNTKWKLFIDNSAATEAAAAATSAAATANTAAQNATNATGYIADTYDATKTYAVGDYVIYSGKLYRCNTAITTAEAWTAAHWTETQVGDDVGELKSALGKDEITSLLLDDPIPDTVQAITFDASGNVQTITYSRDGAAVRTDAFVFADGSITETRTLATGESLTIVTNTDTLVTTSTYAEETA